jgi:uncharacterized protein YjbI with pentapeptide repeats
MELTHGLIGGTPVANDEHVAQLKRGVISWNAWRGDNPGIRPDLTGADLKEARGAILTWADLRGADLVGANLVRAHLLGTHLDGAKLDGAKLRDADLSRADLVEANLVGANLLRTQLGWANLKDRGRSAARSCPPAPCASRQSPGRGTAGG